MAQLSVPIVVNGIKLAQEAVRLMLCEAEFSDGASEDFKFGFYAFGNEVCEALGRFIDKYEGAGEWISVDDFLPAKDGTYLVIGKSGTPHTAHFYRKNEHSPNDDRFRAHFSNQYVTHWMPLPEPPKVGATDESKN